MNQSHLKPQQNKLFGTDGIRNTVGVYPFTPDALPRLGRAIALWALEKYGPHASFLLAADPRHSGPWIKAQLGSGLLSSPVTVHDAGILPTPALFHLITEESPYTCGIMISASHNPAQDNGIKLVDANGGKLTPQDEARISELMMIDKTSVNYQALGQWYAITEAQKMYINKIVSLFCPTFLKNKTIVLDCANGATYQVAPSIFKALGAHIHVLHNAPDGFNINKDCGALHLTALQQAVIDYKADFGFAFDGDGDRIVAVNNKGEIKDGDDILAVLTGHADYKNLAAVVTTVMANQGLEAFLKTQGKTCIRTGVGDKYVVEALQKNMLTLGGEPSGHIVLNNLVHTGDGILVALKILETVTQNGNIELASFTKFPQVLINVSIRTQKNLNESPLADIIAASKARLHAGRLLVRYSGTEPIVRVMVEDEDSALTLAVAERLAHELRLVLS